MVISLIGEEEVSLSTNVENANNLIRVGDENRGFTIIKGIQGIIPVDSIKFVKSSQNIHTKVGDGSINSEQEGVLRSTQLKYINGIEVELKKHEEKVIEPVKNFLGELEGYFSSVKKTNKEKRLILSNTIGSWTQKAKQKRAEEMAIKQIEADRIAAIRKRQRDAEIEAKRIRFEELEKEKQAKIEERKKAERERIEKERQLSQIEVKIEEVGDNKDELGEDVVNKTLEELTQQKNVAVSEYEEIKADVVETREVARSASTEVLLAKEEIRHLEQEPILAVPEPTIELATTEGVTVAEYDRWEVENIDALPDEWAIITKIENKEKITKAFKTDPYMEIPGIRRYVKYIPRAIAECP